MMSIINGVGDEVVQFFVALSVISIIFIAWWTTSINVRRDDIRIVYLIGRNSRNTSNLSQSPTITESTLPVSSSDDMIEPNQPTIQNTDANKPPEPGTSSASGSARTPTEREQDEIIERMDAESPSTIRRRRVLFFESRVQDEPENSSESLIRSTSLVDENAENTERCLQTQQEEPPLTAVQDQEVDAPDIDESSIKIKLKFINDDLKMVDGRLDEELGSFRRRHFSEEISTNKMVRFIFNGQMLQQDNVTLQSCGFFNNCVVHCLIHQRRNQPQEGENAANVGNAFASRNYRGTGLNNNNNNSRDWDLSNILIALVSFSLGSAWYFRYQYPQLFTVTATVALVAITGIFSIVSIGMYFPDQEPTALIRNVQ